MAAELLNRGRDLFAQKQGLGLPLVINRFVLANVPAQNPATPINLDENLPSSGQIVGTFSIPAESRGYVSPDRVVYSLLMGPLIGPFEFNWVGLLADNDDLVAVSHIPTTQKYATSGGALGNSLTRNFLIEYQNAQSITGITVEAGTWQVDFTARFNQQSDLMRSLAKDFYGNQFFIDDAFKVIRAAGLWKLSPGVGYVHGVRVVNPTLSVIDTPALPVEVWLDVYIDKNISSVDHVFTVAALPAGTPLANYIAPNGIQHYVTKIATLTSVGSYSDNRRKSTVGDEGIVGGQKSDWDDFLAEFGGKTDFIHLIVNTPLQKNTRIFSDGGLSHTLPPTAGLLPGTVVRVLKKAVDIVFYYVENIATDLIKYDGDLDTSIKHDVDEEKVFLWTGIMWECK